MRRISIVVVLLALSFFGYIVPSIVKATEHVQLASQCNKRMGPYLTQHEAENAAQSFRNRGFETSGVWGEGGVVSHWSNRRYFFNLFYPC